MGLCIMWLMFLRKREREFGTEITCLEEERDVRGPGEKIVKFKLRRAGWITLTSQGLQKDLP